MNFSPTFKVVMLVLPAALTNPMSATSDRVLTGLSWAMAPIGATARSPEAAQNPLNLNDIGTSPRRAPTEPGPDTRTRRNSKQDPDGGVTRGSLAWTPPRRCYDQHHHARFVPRPLESRRP